MSSWSWKAWLAGAAIAAVSGYALAQMPAGHQGMREHMGAGGPQLPSQMMRGQQGMHGPMGGHPMMMGPQAEATGQPTMAGQNVFGAIHDVVRILDADPSTDWSKANIGALHEHLVDMDEVMLRATVREQPLDNGVELTVTGEGRTLAAIKRMLPAHAHELGEMGWAVSAEDLPDGVRLVVSSADARQVIKLKALGFMGIMVQGGHHPAHHLMIAKGEPIH